MYSSGFIRRLRLSLPFLFLALAFSLPMYSGVPSKPVPPRLVNDFAHVFTTFQADELEKRLTAFDDTTSNQIAVVTVSDLDGYDPNQFAVEIGLKWGVGSSKFNNGVVLLVKPKNGNGRGQVSIQVGYGLEGAIPDIYAKRIISEVLIPAFQKNDYYGGVSKACDKLMGLASGEISVKREFESDSSDTVLSTLICFLLIFAMFVYFSKRGGGGRGNGPDSNKRIYIGPLDLQTWFAIFGPGNFGGHGGGHGGGFGGFGGGSFGGGGASGSW